MKGVDTSRGTLVYQASNVNRPVLKLAYFFSGVKRKASIGEFLKNFCAKFDVGLEMHEVDILVGGSEHDLMDKEMQAQWIARIESGEFDFAVFTPPCGTWSRANWANNTGPSPCRDRQHPWGLPGQLAPHRRRAEAGNEFITSITKF